MMVVKIKLLIFFFLIGVIGNANADTTDFYGKDLLIGKHLLIGKDSTNELQFKNIGTLGNYINYKSETPNLGLSTATFWIKFSIVNHTNNPQILLEIAYPLIQSCDLYGIKNLQIDSQKVIENESYYARQIKHQNIVLPLNILPGDIQTYYLKIKSSKQIVLPLIVHNLSGFFASAQLGEIITGTFIGILMVMALYNLFIFFSIKDRSYLFYVLYIISIGLAQVTLLGYSYKYLWPNHPIFNDYAIVLFSSMAGIFAILFIMHFLHTKEKLPILNKCLYFIIILYILAVGFIVGNNNSVSFRLLDFAGLLGAIITLTIAGKMSLQGYRPARFFLLAWLLFLSGLILFVMRNFNILPYNTFTNYTFQLGTAMEVILLSFALGDKINILEIEKRVSQQQALEISLENQKIIKEQNVILEQKVEERTIQLTSTNEQLNGTLTKLKDAQSLLVDAEKMASLGQLTAGIAHEINNPINFVSSNIKPLKRDILDIVEILNSYNDISGLHTIDEIKEKIKSIDDLKKELDLDYLQKEIEMLLVGMEDGANRTVEIVRGLKVFSRVDESDLKYANINDGIQSTLIILNNQMGSKTKVHKQLGSLPDIECFAGKLNQVFMNILSNAIFATQSNTDARAPEIWVKTCLQSENEVSISIKDNGSGIPEDIQSKIFQPFFTTKEVGKGTGLGLSIVYQIIEMHHGKIEVISTINEGTEFIITLPIVHIP